MNFDRENATVAMRATWAETIKQGQIIEGFGQKVNIGERDPEENKP